MISVYGATGFIGSNFCNQNNRSILKIDRDQRIPLSKDILYFISTTDNNNIFSDITIDVHTNLRVLCEVLNHCRDSSFTFNFISSWFVYGNVDLPAKEDSICAPKGFYSITKKAAEDLLISFCSTYGVSYRILRLCNVLGVGDLKASTRKNAITHMINNLKDGADVLLYDNGRHSRDIMHILDICRAINLVIQKGNTNTIYNIGRGHAVTIREIIDAAYNCLNSNSQIINTKLPPEYRHSHIDNMILDVKKLQSLGFKPAISIQTIVEELCTIS